MRQVVAYLTGAERYQNRKSDGGGVCHDGVLVYSKGQATDGKEDAAHNAKAAYLELPSDLHQDPEIAAADDTDGYADLPWIHACTVRR